MWMVVLLPASRLNGTDRVSDPEIMANTPTPRLIIVMGVCGSGKSTIAKMLANALNADFLDADDYHPAANVAKMSRGDALNDEDRWPWLKDFAQAMASQSDVCVGACSALKKSYRDSLYSEANESVLFVHLDGNKPLLMERMSARTEHFMPTALLDSQLATLEMPGSDECAISVDISGTPQQIIQLIQQQIKENGYDK